MKLIKRGTAMKLPKRVLASSVAMTLPINYEKADAATRRAARFQYERNQQGLCCHCHGDLHDIPPKEIRSIKLNLSLFPVGFLKYPVHLHHCHSTGMTIGAVHSYCNAVLWQYHGE